MPVEVIESEAVGYWQRHVRLDEQRSAEIRQVVANWLLSRQASSGKTITVQRMPWEAKDPSAFAGSEVRTLTIWWAQLGSNQ